MASHGLHQVNPIHSAPRSPGDHPTTAHSSPSIRFNGDFDSTSPESIMALRIASEAAMRSRLETLLGANLYASICAAGIVINTSARRGEDVVGIPLPVGIPIPPVEEPVAGWKLLQCMRMYVTDILHTMGICC